MFPSPKLTPVMLALPALWALHWWRSGSPFPKTTLNFPLLLLAVMLLVSLYATFSIEFSLSKISNVMLGFGLFFGILRFASSSDRWILSMGAFLIAGLVVAVLGLIGGIWPSKLPILGQVGDALPQLVTGIPGAEIGFHPNQISGTLLWVVQLFWTVTLALFLLRKQIFSRYRPVFRWAAVLILLLIAISISAVLLMTQSRAAYMGLAGGSIVLISPILPRRVRWPVLIVGLGLVVALGVVLLGDSFSLSQEGFVSEISASGALSVQSLPARFEIWSRALYGIQDFAFTGMGMNTFRRVVQVLYPLFAIAPDKDIAHAHNHLLQTALDVGLPGLIAYLALMISALAMLVRIWNHRPAFTFPPTLTAAFVLGLGGGLIAHSIYGLLDAVVLGAKPGFLWWWLHGLVASLYQLGTSGYERSYAKGVVTSNE
jgi:putative inorganic carbon (HCO3(-)) transporter